MDFSLGMQASGVWRTSPRKQIYPVIAIATTTTQKSDHTQNQKLHSGSFDMFHQHFLSKSKRKPLPNSNQHPETSRCIKNHQLHQSTYWFKEKITRKPHSKWKNLWFPISPETNPFHQPSALPMAPHILQWPRSSPSARLRHLGPTPPRNPPPLGAGALGRNEDYVMMIL